MGKVKNVIYKKLNKLREDKGLTRVELAKRAGVDVKTIDRYLDGTRDPNTVKTKRLAESLECSVGELFGEIANK